MHNDSCQSSQVQGPRGCSPLAMGISYRSPRLCHPVFHKHFAKGTEKQLCRLSGTTWARLPAVEAFVGGCSPGHLPLREAAAALSWTDETPGQPPSLQPQPTFSTSTCSGKPGRSTPRHSSAPPELLWVMKRKKIPPRAGETSIHTYVGLCSTSYPPSVVHLDVRLCICG